MTLHSTKNKTKFKYRLNSQIIGYGITLTIISMSSLVSTTLAIAGYEPPPDQNPPRNPGNTTIVSL